VRVSSAGTAVRLVNLTRAWPTGGGQRRKSE